MAYDDWKTNPGPEPAPVTVEDLTAELDEQGWHHVHGPDAVVDLRSAGLDHGATYYIQPDLVVIWSADGETKHTASHDGEGLVIDGQPCDSLREALGALGIG
jgi:hypothetical protein